MSGETADGISRRNMNFAAIVRMDPKETENLRSQPNRFISTQESGSNPPLSFAWIPWCQRLAALAAS